MASLNTLRTKFGIVLSIVIAGALLAFILSLKTEMGFSGNDPRVGVINGKKSQLFGVLQPVRADQGAERRPGKRRTAVRHARQCCMAGPDRQVCAGTRFPTRWGCALRSPSVCRWSAASIRRRRSTTPSPIPARVSTTWLPSDSSSRRPKRMRRHSRRGRSSTSRPAWSVRSPSTSA